METGGQNEVGGFREETGSMASVVHQFAVCPSESHCIAVWVAMYTV